MENHHSADLALTYGFYEIAASCGTYGWVVGTSYFVIDLGVQAYSGKSITQNLLD